MTQAKKEPYPLHKWPENFITFWSKAPQLKEKLALRFEDRSTAVYMRQQLYSCRRSLEFYNHPTYEDCRHTALRLEKRGNYWVIYGNDKFPSLAEALARAGVPVEEPDEPDWSELEKLEAEEIEDAPRVSDDPFKEI